MVRIKFLNDLKIDSFSDSSGLFSGENRQASYRSFKKQKQGFGTVSGHGNQTKDIINIVTNQKHTSKESL